MDKQKYILFLFSQGKEKFIENLLYNGQSINDYCKQTILKKCLGPTLLLSFSTVMNMLGIELEMICSPVLE